MKTCIKCSQELPLTEFSKNKSRKNGYEYQCKKCRSKYHMDKQYNKKFIKNNPNYIINYMISIPPGVYMIKNQITGECYIGQSKRPYQRRTQHFSIHSKNEGASVKSLQLAMKQYGSESFVFGILEHCELEQLLERERYYINLFNPEYNLI
jgi:hypothetical protein